jgi:hypothetical protein
LIRASLEDIKEFRDEVIHFRGLLERPRKSLTSIELRSLAADANRRVDAYRSLLKTIITHLDQLLEFATDPAMSLAEEISRLHRERTSDLTELHQLRTERDSQLSELRQLRAERDLATAELRRIRSARDLTLARLRKELKAAEVAQTQAVSSYQGELAQQKKTYDRRIEETQQQHTKELERLRIASRIESNEWRKKLKESEAKLTGTINNNPQIQPEEFSTLVQNYLSPRVSSSPQKEGKRNLKATSRPKK